MNESIYICAGSLCCCLVVCALVRLISPSGNTSKILSLIIGMFALCCLVSPVVSVFEDFNLDLYEEMISTENTEFSEIYDEQVLRTTGEYINSYTIALLQNAEISAENIETILGVAQDKGIYIREMNIYVKKNSTDKAIEIEDLIKTTFGIVPKVTEI